MTDTYQRSAASEEKPEQSHGLEREVIKDLELSEELAEGIKGGNRHTGDTTPTGCSGPSV